jgi:hypothetical protein
LDGLGLVMVGHVGYDGERDLLCVVQGLWKVVCQASVVWLCVDPRSYVVMSPSLTRMISRNQDLYGVSLLK